MWMGDDRRRFPSVGSFTIDALTCTASTTEQVALTHTVNREIDAVVAPLMQEIERTL
ncbi:hypothetical protein NKJ88_31580 [Mesorhizobium sp. M0016]|uniref:hypothetical protein n=1 Tax=Mesorhizobium sp. M0016 TaxID=2956843 RepID=UPI00333B924C